MQALDSKVSGRTVVAVEAQRRTDLVVFSRRIRDDGQQLDAIYTARRSLMLCRHLSSAQRSLPLRSLSLTQTLTLRRSLAVPAAVRPYFELARLDKPIGTWLLYWPCGTLAHQGCDG